MSVTKVGAPDVWTKGYTGQGVIVGILDTGVFGAHNDLKSNFRADHGWFDPYNRATIHTDTNGHGTHLAGTIASAGGIGVAPGAKWIACRGCYDSCTASALLKCGEFMLCPSDPSDTSKDCSKAPRVINNSWGGDQNSTTHQVTVNAWRAAGIIPVFSNGNHGPECSIANSPGDLQNMISVGSTKIDDGLSSFSSKGPALNDLVKPNVSAP